MEYGDGGSLDQHLRILEVQLPERRILTMFSQIASGLRFMHSKHILHRDLKTANIFLTKDGFVKIGDLGIAKIMVTLTEAGGGQYNNNGQRKKQNATLVGTPYYISPEIAQGNSYNAQTDMWSAGCILYEICMLRKTFDSSNLPALISKIVSGKIPPLKGNYSSELRQLLKKLLSQRPEDRPTAHELYFSLIPEITDRLSLKEQAKEQATLMSLGKGMRQQMSHQLFHVSARKSKVTRVRAKSFPSRLRVAQISIGITHGIIVSEDRSVYRVISHLQVKTNVDNSIHVIIYEITFHSWGSNDYGQLGHGATSGIQNKHTGGNTAQKAYKEPTIVKSLTGKSIIRACAGNDFSVFLSDNGIVMSCGRGEDGCLGHGNYNNVWKPRLVESLLEQNIVQVSAIKSHVLALDADKKTIFVWGRGKMGALGLGHLDDVLQIVEK